MSGVCGNKKCDSLSSHTNPHTTLDIVQFTMPAKGNVDRERWIAKAREQERFIISTGGVNSSATWNERTLANRANLEDWQEDYLVAINYPRDRKEDKQRKKEFRRAKKMRDVATVLEEAKTNGSTLPPYKILRAYKAYGDGIKLGDFVEERALGIASSLPASSVADSMKYSSAECEDVVLDEFSRFHTTPSDFCLADEEWAESSPPCPPLPGEDAFVCTDEEWDEISTPTKRSRPPALLTKQVLTIGQR